MKRLVLVLLAVALASTGCGKIREKLAQKAAEKAIERSTGGEVQLGGSSGTVTVKDAKGGAQAQFGAGAKLPDDWPAKVPAYPGATVIASASTPNGKTAQMSSKDAPDKVFDFYKSKMSGLTKTGEVNLPNMRTMALKDGASTISITVMNGEAGGSTISLSIGAR